MTTSHWHQPVEPDQLQQLLQRFPNTLLIDVRDRADHAALRLPGSVCVPLAEIQLEAAVIERHSDDPTRPILLICQLGKRGLMAAEHLQLHLSNPLFVLEGGLNACAGIDIELVYGSEQ